MKGVIPAEYVRARWAYSELLSPTQGESYHQHGGVPEALKNKKVLGLPFDELEAQEQGLLAQAWCNVRGAEIFVRALANISAFHLTHWSKEQLAAAYVIPMFAHEATLDPWKPVTFEQWLETESKVSLHPHHAREASKSSGDPDPHQDPATASWASRILKQAPADAYMLLDGYRRAARFWKEAKSAATLAVYIPVRAVGRE
jgi:hypothetical protein